ncbi:hypothetical protein RIR_jg23706.t1 [Rhizophagus irregularis DAOM 181602=DAOM 197198]|nr:hypothetical protein RIR_jg23706.t1 [Rhizophagus irregularis DAOM 181602=DAOM 197198]
MISYCGFRAQQIHMFLIMLCFYFYIICKNMKIFSLKYFNKCWTRKKLKCGHIIWIYNVPYGKQYLKYFCANYDRNKEKKRKI